ncbi:MAG: hypothetical protein JWM11_3978 [Planctomycetaceae bacterium]|nr:hypothetical protein [Planctomycetaceae bacterium]
MPNALRVGLFCALIVASLLSGGWVIYNAIDHRSYRLELLDPDRSNTVDASIIDRRLLGQDHDVKYRFQPAEQQAAPITTKWVTIPKAVYDSLPESNATLPVAYVKGAPERHQLTARLETESYRREIEEELTILVGLGAILPWVAVPWAFWLCFASAKPLTISCRLGCLNNSNYDYSGGALQMVMNYRTVSREYTLDASQHVDEFSCAFCGKPMKVRIASSHEARLPAPGLYSLCLCTGLMTGVLTPLFWAACPAWFPAVSMVAGLVIGGITFRHMWKWPAHFSAITLVEGRGNIVHSKTADNGTVITWYEHEVMK